MSAPLRYALLPLLLTATAHPAPPETPDRILRVEILGAKSVPLKTIQDAAANVAVETRATPGILRRTAEAVRAVYVRRGYALAQVVTTELTPDGTLKVTVAEGIIRKILLRGNRKTLPSTLRTAVLLKPNDVYREQNARDGRDALARLGIFDDVFVSAVPAGSVPEQEEIQPDEADYRSPVPVTPESRVTPRATNEDNVGLVDIIVKIKERRTGNVAATLGYTETTGLIGYVDVAEENLFGTAQRVNVQWQRISSTFIDQNGFAVQQGGDRMAYGASYDRPSLGRGGIAFGVDAYDKNTVFLPFFTNNVDTIRSYERRRGGVVRIGRPFGGGLSAFVTVRRDEIGYANLPDALSLSRTDLAKSTGVVGAMGVRIVADRRDNAADPRGGGLGILSLENAGSFLGGNLSFQKATLDMRRYIPLTPIPKREREAGGTILALRLLSGTTSGRVPLPEQFWIGGYDLLRGYDLFEFRGERLILGSMEARLTLNPGLQGVLFVDAGSAWGGGRSFQPKTGVGAGVRFLTPIGPIRLDAAYGNRLQTYISLGQAY